MITQRVGNHRQFEWVYKAPCFNPKIFLSFLPVISPRPLIFPIIGSSLSTIRELLGDLVSSRVEKFHHLTFLVLSIWECRHTNDSCPFHHDATGSRPRKYLNVSALFSKNNQMRQFSLLLQIAQKLSPHDDWRNKNQGEHISRHGEMGLCHSERNLKNVLNGKVNRNVLSLICFQQRRLPCEAADVSRGCCRIVSRFRLDAEEKPLSNYLLSRLFEVIKQSHNGELKETLERGDPKRSTKVLCEI